MEGNDGIVTAARYNLDRGSPRSATTSGVIGGNRTQRSEIHSLRDYLYLTITINHNFVGLGLPWPRFKLPKVGVSEWQLGQRTIRFASTVLFQFPSM